MADYSFFGPADRNKQGRVASEMPSWSMPRHLDELKENIDRQERYLERGEIPLDRVPYVREEIKRGKEKMNSILSSKPNLSDKQKDHVHKVFEDLKNKIPQTMYTRKDEKDGVADPHEEARRMVNPIIPVDKETAEACEIALRKGMVSRNEATRMLKIIGSYLGEEVHIEQLRRDKKDGRWKS